MTRLPVEPVYLYGGDDYVPSSPKWVPMVGHPGYVIARQPYPSTDRKRRCVACRAAGDELAYCIGALSLGGAHWSQQGDVCEPCAVRLIGLVDDDRPATYTQLALFGASPA